jgi:uncharacterized protein with von Willebrand factor type A (vWA) domain
VESLSGLVNASLRLVRELRDGGVAVTASHGVEAVRALELLDLGDREEVRRGLRCVLVSRPEDGPVFEQAFSRLWEGRVAPEQRTVTVPELVRLFAAGSGRGETGMSPHQRPDGGEFGVEGAELGEVTRLAERMARRLATREGRRWRPSARGGRVHLRRTMRHAASAGFEAVELRRAERKPRRSRLVVLADVSGSMDHYTRFFLQFLYAFARVFRQVETFVFSTRLERVTGHLRGPRFDTVVERLQAVSGWSGGTRIGECLAEYWREWGERLDPHTVVIVVSDGWDTGPPERLAEIAAMLQRRARRLVWLNPLLGSPTYRPLTRGMQAALPYVDVFAPVHDLDSLRALEPHLRLSQGDARQRLA